MNRPLKSLLFSLIFFTSATSFDNPHFYRAAFFFGEPRLEKDRMTTCDITFAGGSTSKGRNACGEKTDILNIYGLHNMTALSRGMPNLDENNDLDLILDNLTNAATCNCLGHLYFCGKFRTWELDFLLTQNIYKGLFCQVHIPFRRLEINSVQYKDLSPTTCPSHEWNDFLSSFKQILARYNLNLGPIKRTGSGDISLAFGWTCNYQDTEEIDYLDFTARAGIMIPTGQKKSEDIVFDLPLGYNDHIGFFMNLDAAFGIYDWLSIGGHVGARFFTKNSNCGCSNGCSTCMYRMKTDMSQCGFIKLVKGKALMQPGSITDVGLFAKADHVVRGLSFLGAYSYHAKGRDYLTPCDNNTFNASVVNSDEQLKEWTMHTIHLAIEYDFTKEHMKAGPRLGMFYNGILAGKRIFNTHMLGGSLGVDVAWSFD